MKPLYLFVCIWCMHVVFGQNYTTWNSLKVHPEVMFILHEAEKDITHSYPILQKALQKAESLNHPNSLSYVYVYLGDYYTNIEKNFLKGISLYQQAGNLMKEPKSPESEAFIYKKIGLSFLNNLDYIPSIEAFEKGIQFAQKAQKPELVADLQIRLGETYYQTLNYSKALEYYQKGRDFFATTKNLEYRTWAMSKIAEVYFHLDEMDKVLQILDEIIAFCEEGKDLNRAGPIYSWKGNIFMNLGNLEESRLNYAKAIEIRKKTKMKLV